MEDEAREYDRGIRQIETSIGELAHAVELMNQAHTSDIDRLFNRTARHSEILNGNGRKGLRASFDSLVERVRRLEEDMASNAVVSKPSDVALWRKVGDASVALMALAAFIKLLLG